MRGLTDAVMRRTLVYVEGDATMRPYENREGKTEYGLNIVQSECCPPLPLTDVITNSGLADVEKLEILERRSEQLSTEQRLEQE